jgi:CheY-like chemotaxis protein
VAKKILLIEDDGTVRLMAVRILTKAGYRVLEAPDGREGVRIYREELPDLVVTDIFMPEKEGLETIAELAGEYPGIRIVAVSGGGTLGILNPLPMAAKLGASRTLAKPYGRTDLLDAVMDLIGPP